MGNVLGTEKKLTTTNADLTKEKAPMNPKCKHCGPLVERMVLLSAWAQKYMEGIDFFHNQEYIHGHIEFVIPPSSPKVIIRGHEPCVKEALLDIHVVLDKASNNSKGISFDLEEETNFRETNVDLLTVKVPVKDISDISSTQIHNLSEEQLNMLPDTDVPDMSSTQIQNLSEEQLNMLPDTDVPDMSSTQIQNLSEAQLNIQPDTDVSDMSSTQIQNLNEEQLNVVTETDVSDMSYTPIQSLSEEQLSVVTDTDGPDIPNIDRNMMDQMCLIGESDSKDQGARADEGHVKKRISTYKEVVKLLTKTEVKQLESIAVLANLKIDQSNGIIIMEGQSTDVLVATSELETRLEEYKFTKERDRKARDLYMCVRWRYQGMVGDDCIEDYDQLTNMLLEKSYMDGDAQLHLVDEEGVKSLVIFGQMVEYIENEDQDCVKVTRTVVNPDGSTSTLKEFELVWGKIVEPEEHSSDKEPQPFPDSQEYIPQPRDQRNLKLEDQYVKRTMEVDRALVNVLTKQEVIILQDVQALANVKIDITNGYITLDGPSRDVKNAEATLEMMLQHIHRKRKLDIELQTPNTIVKWCFAPREGPHDVIDYEEKINEAIEASFRNMNDEIRLFDISGKEYVIDFVRMIEYVEPNRNDLVYVSRRVITQQQEQSS